MNTTAKAISLLAVVGALALLAVVAQRNQPDPCAGIDPETIRHQQSDPTGDPELRARIEACSKK